ncbi:S46 family peptidase [Erythrobacter sp. HL-111]|uniref:S46 family peptidase n=1 Tax=Erythrobacter sp. HL-111 TaxID=1798193 RepID=UPI0006D97C22|nr:S46 family peptidase [Erythrobacter sp. HL-111]KPP88115.1 MAG: Peptidase S46 [Erythrobacteraceae bacterium HL-111]SDT09771.1 Peptidase S46 [Erythrobacter sp. HL-111]
MTRKLLAATLLASVAASPLSAKEGMFTPDQLQEIAGSLEQAGLEIDAEELADLTGFPMGAIVSLGGCSASFVSPTGLVVTNHHCARGSVQYNSTAENNYLENGFLANALGEELPAAPGSRIYVTTQVTDVTGRVREGTEGMEPLERYELVQQRSKDITAECEEDPGHRCQVASFYGGAEYKLIKRLEVRDVRLVYAPADSIGKYGGDIDNWMWPRHTGDFAFYRAYVAPDGSAADYAEENVPYEPEHHLKVSAAGLDEGDFVMAAGYPGSTSRYTLMAEVENTFGWTYPTFQQLLTEWIATIEQVAPEGSDARVKYESRLAGLNNFEKNLRGQIEGARRVGLVERRRAREEALAAWIDADPARAEYGEAIAQLARLSEESAAAIRTNFWYNNATRPALLGVAERLYRLSKERQKDNAQREPGYQERDMGFFRQGLQALERRYDPAVDKAEWLLFLRGYLAQPAAERVAAFDAALGITQATAPEDLPGLIDRFYAGTSLDDAETRLALMEATPGQIEASDDPFLELAVALYDYGFQLETEAKTRAGRALALRPAYMEAITAWQRESGVLTYPDANSTLRVTYGEVLGGSPRDGMAYYPFTTLEGITEKDTGEDPFNAPADLLNAVEAKDYGPYALESIGSVPVNFLSDLDSTGGNSGSATLNARAELVGLLFDGTFESVNSDWDFDPRTTRTIHVDTRYMLWVMDKIDGAGRLIEEMDIVR